MKQCEHINPLWNATGGYCFICGKQKKKPKKKQNMSKSDKIIGAFLLITFGWILAMAQQVFQYANAIKQLTP